LWVDLCIVSNQSGDYNSKKLWIIDSSGSYSIISNMADIEFVKAKFFHCLAKLITNICVNIFNVISINTLRKTA